MRPVVRLGLKIYFNKMVVSGLEHLPEGQPIILTCNHPNSFLEACVLACFLPRPVYFLTRGDVMKEKKLDWFFRSTNQIPIYRFRDGYSNLRKNAETFKRCNELLEDNSLIVIFAEGSTEMVKQLRSLQQGFARIAIGALQKTDLSEILIQAAGMNFQNPAIGGAYAEVHIGPGIKTSDYLKSYSDKPKETLALMAQQQYETMLPLVIHLPPEFDQGVLNNLIDIDELSSKGKSKSVLKKHQAICDQMTKNSSALLGEDLDVSWKNKRLLKSPVSIGQKLLCVIGMVLHNTIGIPSIISRKLALQKVEEVEFRAPVRIGTAIIFHSLWFVLLTAIFAAFNPVYAILPAGLFLVYLYLWKTTGDYNPYFYLTDSIQSLTEEKMNQIHSRIKKYFP